MAGYVLPPTRSRSAAIPDPFPIHSRKQIPKNEIFRYEIFRNKLLSIQQPLSEERIFNFIVVGVHHMPGML